MDLGLQFRTQAKVTKEAVPDLIWLVSDSQGMR